MTLRGAWHALAGVVVAGLVGWWLFADTVRHYASRDENAPLRVAFWGDFVEYQMWKRFRGEWRKRHPDVPVKLEYYITGSRYGQKIQQLLVADAAPDVFLFQDEPMPQFIDMGKFEDLTPYLDTPGARLVLGEYWETAVSSFAQKQTRGGVERSRQYGIPLWGGCNLVVYNCAAFRRAGIEVRRTPWPTSPASTTAPAAGGLTRTAHGWVLDDTRWTVDEFVRVCQLLTGDDDGDGRIDRYGFLHPGTTYWLPWHWALGAQMLTKDLTRTAFYGPACERSLQLWQDLRYKLHVSPTPAELGVMGQNVGFLTGRIAMMSQGPWVMPFFNDAHCDYGVLHTPRGPDGTRATRITWDAAVMFKGSKRKSDAWRFIQFLASPTCQKILATYQRSIPARKDGRGAFLAACSGDQAATFAEAAATYARVQPITKHWEAMYNVWLDCSDMLRDPRDAKRVTPAEAIGRFYSLVDQDHRQLHKHLPPADPAEAERYRRIYEAGQARRKGKR